MLTGCYGKGMAVKKGYPIFWNGHFVGDMRDPVVDNWFVFGKWEPEGSEHSDAFLEAVRQAEANDNGVDIEFGTFRRSGTIYTTPSTLVEIRTI